MSNLRQTIEALATQFASSILDALRSASIDELADVAGRSGGARRARPARAEAEPTVASGAPRRRGRGGRLGRRSAGDISAMVEQIVALLADNAEGLRAEQIREALSVEAKELPRPLAEALSAGRITKSGQKRATTYFAAGGGAGGGAAKRRGRPAAGRRSKKR
jgi:hypothetical protein